MRGQKHDCSRRRTRAQLPRQVEAAAVGQSDIEYRELKIRFGHRPARTRKRICARDREARGLEPLGQRFGNVAFILQQQQPRTAHRGRHGAHCSGLNG